jgi:hypothetical protein
MAVAIVAILLLGTLAAADLLRPHRRRPDHERSAGSHPGRQPERVDASAGLSGSRHSPARLSRALLDADRSRRGGP